jgi:hypothetical protein
MVRSILVGLLVISGASACKGGGSDAPAVQPGKTVGKVVEITGKVTATRGTAVRDLDASSTVSGDDVITTAADGRVTILLEHNNAKWDLGPNKHEQVSTSMAWQLAKVDAPAGKVDETTTAAGRHAERAAANGESAAAPAATADRARAADEAPGGPPPTAQAPAAGEAMAPPPPPPPPTAQPTTAAPAAKSPRPVATSKGSPPAPPRIAAPKPTKDSAASASDPLAPSDAPQSNRRSAVQIESAKAPDLDKDKLADEGGGGVPPLQAAVDKEHAALKACVVASGKDKLAIKVHFAKGVASIVLADGSAADKACVAKVAARIKLTVDAADYSTVIAK